MVDKLKNNAELIGAAPTDIVTQIIQQNPQIAAVNLWTYTYKPLQFQERGENSNWIPRDKWNDGHCIYKILFDLDPETQIGIFSQVKLNDGRHAHIPLMDFEIAKDGRGLSLVLDRLRRAEIHNGWLLETNKSFHYYGASLLNSDREWMTFMGDCLLTSVVHDREHIEQIADPRYIGHSLKRGGNVLRLTTRADKTFVPKVVAYLE